jgi:hypothetical protein
MATNLVSLVMQFLTPDMIAKIASALGLDRTVAQKAIGGAVPALLSVLANVASSPGGARQLSNAVAQQQPGALDSLKSLIEGSGQRAFADTGSSMLSTLLGGGALDAVTQSVGKFAGIGEGASKSLLGMLGPMVIGALGQQQRSAGLDASGLASLLTSQKDQLAAAVPSGLADQLSATGLFDNVVGGIRSGAASASAAATRIGRSAAERTAAEASQAAYAARGAAAHTARSAASSQWAYWAIGLVALGALAWYFLGNIGEDRVAELPPPATTQPATKPAARAVDTVGLATPSLNVGGVNLVNQINSSVGSLRTALSGITDAASAEAALPKIREATSQLEQVGTLSERLSPEGKSALAKLIMAAMPTINQLCDKVLATPGVGPVARPAIDELRGRLDTLARA